METVQKVIANCGYTSRRKAEELILNGHVTVNGELVNTLGVKVNKNDIICINGNTINKNIIKEYYLLNKPREVICSVEDDKGRKTVVDLIPTKTRIYPVGRLDYDTTGLLLLTNDGEFAQFMMHPKNEIDKVYVAKVKGIIGAETIKKLESGIVIDGVKTSNARVKLRKKNMDNLTSIVQITIHEGKNHQVKRMFEEVGYEVIKLKRERVGFLDLSGLSSGEYRTLNPKEIKQLYDLVNRKGKK